MVTPETLAAAWRVAQHGALSAMLAARAGARDRAEPAALQQGAGSMPASTDSRQRSLPA